MTNHTQSTTHTHININPAADSSQDSDFSDITETETMPTAEMQTDTEHPVADADAVESDNANNKDQSVSSIAEQTPIVQKPKRDFFSPKNRKWFLLWLYAVAIGHFLVGFLLATQSDHPLINFYHQSVERFFWQGEVPEMARSQQIWWMSLFGATLQYLAILIGVLIYLGQRYKSRLVWFSLIVAFLVWLPQDCWISFQAQQYLHIVINLFAALCMLFPLFALIKIDKMEMRCRLR